MGCEYYFPPTEQEDYSKTQKEYDESRRRFKEWVDKVNSSPLTILYQSDIPEFFRRLHLENKKYEI